MSGEAPLRTGIWLFPDTPSSTFVAHAAQVLAGRRTDQILLPTVAVIAYWSWTPIVFSWRRLEGSRALDGLPGVFLLKSVILLFCALMAVQALVYLRANLRALRSPPSRT